MWKVKLPFPYLLLPLTVTSEEEEATDRQKSFLLGKRSHNCKTLLRSLKLKWPKGILIFLQAGSWELKVVGLSFCIKKNHHRRRRKVKRQKSGTFVNGLPRSINLSYLASFSSSPSQFFFLYALFDVTTTKEQNVSQKWRRSCTTNDDGCAVICHAKKEFVGRWPKTSIGNESGWPCTTRIPICWDLKVSVTWFPSDGPYFEMSLQEASAGIMSQLCLKRVQKTKQNNT